MRALGVWQCFSSFDPRRPSIHNDPEKAWNRIEFLSEHICKTSVRERHIYLQLSLMVTVNMGHFYFCCSMTEETALLSGGDLDK